ncbi:hypothetical protein EON65_57580 [archaeon]|nr:MAG: hypothetical protein EON65_57580 [archaeon]
MMNDDKEDKESGHFHESKIGDSVCQEEFAEMSSVLGRTALDQTDSFTTPMKNPDSEICAVCLSPLIAMKLNFSNMEYESIHEDRQLVKTKCQVNNHSFATVD